jgi:hypothetical protein
MHVTLLSDPTEDGHAHEVRKLNDLTLGNKKVPAGYFFQPDAENISAVAFSNAGTAAKFTRMGLQAGLDPDTVALRYGFAYGSEADNIVPEAFNAPPEKAKTLPNCCGGVSHPPATFQTLALSPARDIPDLFQCLAPRQKHL